MYFYEIILQLTFGNEFQIEGKNREARCTGTNQDEDSANVETGVDAEAFLLASDGLVAMFDLLGAGVFAFVQADIKSNITGIRERYDANRAESITLEDLVRHEHADGARHGTQCLVRLIRELAFTCCALQTTQTDPVCALHVCFWRAYDVVLRHHHTTPSLCVTLAIRAVPRRDQFFAWLTQGGDAEKFEHELKLAGLDEIVQRMKSFLADGGYGHV
ncbi:glycolipid transfer protein domain-containing protein [Mycena pura]|uniref:Glycolipid transfer protein domain-containing protein n=1 Tax=Mycena pura TaxID=153505 RepID=A0AAD6VC00_9AGAR|nr:glycolipid transfer protein domain-containing protein [Mycena pura]